jgi:hypothetical protein
VVPELGGTTTVVALDGGGLLLTQPESMAPTINNPDTSFIFVSWCNRIGYSQNRLSTGSVVPEIVRCLVHGVHIANLDVVGCPTVHLIAPHG